MKCEIIVDGITVYFNSSKILENIKFEVNKGEMLGIIGPNGAGKTTLLKCIARSIIPKGRIIIFGKPIDEYTNSEYSKIVSALLPNWPIGFNMKVYEVVLMGCRNRTESLWWEKEEDIKSTEEFLKLLKVYHLYDRDFTTLSSGEQRRVLIAKSLVQRTDIILLDEPIAYLDLKYRIEIMEILKSLSKNDKIVIITAHEIDLALSYCDKIIVLNNGKIVAMGRPRDIINEKLIYDVYGIDATIKWFENYPIIIPKRDIKREDCYV